LFFSVKELELHKVPFQVEFPPGGIEFFDPKLKQARPLEVSGTAQLDPMEEIRVRGHLKGLLIAECDRCLEPIEFPLDGDFDLCYRPAESDWGEEPASLSEQENDAGFYDGNGLPLADVVREQVLLWLPMQRICREECKGICPQCGQNRNEIECGCLVERIDERWAALKNI